MKTTNVILFFFAEDIETRLLEINSFKYNSSKSRQLDLVSISDKKLPSGWYGGTKYLECDMFIGSYYDFDEIGFLKHLLQEVNWKRSARFVSVLFRRNDELKYRMFIHSGEKIYNALTKEVIYE